MSRGPKRDGRADRRTRRLLACGVLAGPAFVVNFSINGRRRSGYRPRREAVSALALGDGGWIQTVNFFVTGSLTCAAALGLRQAARQGRTSRAVAALVAAAGAGFISAGIFPTDPIPDESALEPSSLTPVGTLHVASAVPVFLCLPLACVASALRSRSRGGVPADGQKGATGVLVASAGVASLVAAARAGSGFSDPAGQGTRVDNAGLWQRIALVTTLGWLALHSWRLRSAMDGRS
jgi:hypothetical protein